MSDIVTVELNEEIGRKFYKEFLAERAIIDYAHMPFTKFRVNFPISVIVDIDALMTQVSNEPTLNDKESMSFLRTKLEKDVYTLHVDLKENYLQLRLKSTLSDRDSLLVKFNTLLPFPMPSVEFYDFAEEENKFSMSNHIYQLVNNCISYMTNREVVEINTYRKPVNKKVKTKKGNKKVNKTTYINATTYTFKYLPTTAIQEQRKYERHTDSWRVRGFWRTYKKGTPQEYKVWIDSFKKGENTSKSVEKKYKITGGDNNESREN